MSDWFTELGKLHKKHNGTETYSNIPNRKCMFKVKN